jgi:hypothetical protein
MDVNLYILGPASQATTGVYKTCLTADGEEPVHNNEIVWSFLAELL